MKKRMRGCEGVWSTAGRTKMDLTVRPDIGLYPSANAKSARQLDRKAALMYESCGWKRRIVRLGPAVATESGNRINCKANASRAQLSGHTQRHLRGYIDGNSHCTSPKVQ